MPPEIGQLTNLTTLYLGGNLLTNLPAEIGRLTKLSTLYLNDNLLTNLPPEFGQLTNLSKLYLGGNRVINLPPEFGQLSRLTTFTLNNNELANLLTDQLTDLLAEIGQLTKLTTLYLNNNLLTNLPAEIGQLTKLSSLYLNDNLLTNLPAEIGHLINLDTLKLDNNPQLSLPPEIQRKKAREIVKFYRQQLEQKTDRIYEAKLLIIGKGGAGKTTLAQKIQNSDYELQADEDSTEGIDVFRWHFPMPDGKEFRVNIWDFGGQEIYHTTHQFFLTKRSLYTLIADSRKEDTDFYYWLNVVELLSANSPLLIIKNEKQERQREINERQLRGEFTNLKGTLATNLATNRGLPEILTQIKHCISTLPHVGTELPKTWVRVREALEQETRSHIPLTEYLQLCQTHGFTREENKLQLSGYLHDLGVCLHFQEDDLLLRTVILKPTWGTDAVYKVLDNPRVIQNLGKFNKADLKDIWHEAKYATMRPELLRLMMNFKLCYEIPSASGTYIAPQLLSPNQPDYTWDDSANLLLRYEYEFMPKGILTRFIVEMHAVIDQQLVWKSGVILSKAGARAEVLELYRYHKGEIRIRISGNRQRDLLSTIRHELDKIHGSYDRLKYTTLVPCNCPTCKRQTPHFYRLEVLHRSVDVGKDIQCQQSFEMVDVRGLLDDIRSTPVAKPASERSSTIINNYGPTYGVAGNVERDQRIRPHGDREP